MDAIVSGSHGDPFGVLGPHRKEDEWEVRAFLPQAMDAAALVDGVEHPMRKVRTEGFFVATLKNDPGQYRLRLTLWNGGQAEIEDPYRFSPLLSDFDLHLHGEGTQYESYRTMGAHLVECEGVRGVRFAVWAPNAEVMSVVGDFNEWDERRHPMRMRAAGIWEFFMPGAGEGMNYKYSVRSRVRGYRQQKADPYGFATENPPKSASVVCDVGSYGWGDHEWMRRRHDHNKFDAPISIRSSPRLMDARAGRRESLAQLSRACGEAGRLRL